MSELGLPIFQQKMSAEEIRIKALDFSMKDSNGDFTLDKVIENAKIIESYILTGELSE